MKKKCRETNSFVPESQKQSKQAQVFSAGLHSALLTQHLLHITAGRLQWSHTTMWASSALILHNNISIQHFVLWPSVTPHTRRANEINTYDWWRQLLFPHCVQEQREVENSFVCKSAPAPTPPALGRKKPNWHQRRRLTWLQRAERSWSGFTAAKWWFTLILQGNFTSASTS